METILLFVFWWGFVTDELLYIIFYQSASVIWRNIVNIIVVSVLDVNKTLPSPSPLNGHL